MTGQTIWTTISPSNWDPRRRIDSLLRTRFQRQRHHADREFPARVGGGYFRTESRCPNGSASTLGCRTCRTEPWALARGPAGATSGVLSVSRRGPRPRSRREHGVRRSGPLSLRKINKTSGHGVRPFPYNGDGREARAANVEDILQLLADVQDHVADSQVKPGQ